MNPAQPTWNSLEVVKLLVSGLTPVVVLVIGIWVSRSLKRLEFLQWTNQNLTEKRIAVFDELAPLLNDLLCYFTFVGCWKDLTPPEDVKRKRLMDRIVNVNAPLFSREFVKAYNDFINLCYGTYSGWGKDARLRTAWQRRIDVAGASWETAWSECFANQTDFSDPKAVRSSYAVLMSCFSLELGVGLMSDHVPTGRIPANIR